MEIRYLDALVREPWVAAFLLDLAFFQTKGRAVSLPPTINASDVGSTVGMKASDGNIPTLACLRISAIGVTPKPRYRNKVPAIRG